MIQVSIVNKSRHLLPGHQTAGAAGVDVRAFLEAPVLLHPMHRELIPTGLFVEIPEGYEIQIRPRSGLAIKKGLTLINSPGTIDSDYRGEIKVAMINLSREIQTIEDGDRIAQMILARYEQIRWSLVDHLSETARGPSGFGHTGHK